MNPTIIRFPTVARLGEAMAKPLPWYRLMWRRWFGYRRKHLTIKSVRYDRARCDQRRVA
jgi:hypothetical protein